jgi:hypothetical protein
MSQDYEIRRTCRKVLGRVWVVVFRPRHQIRTSRGQHEGSQLEPCNEVETTVKDNPMIEKTGRNPVCRFLMIKGRIGKDVTILMRG